jgi:4-amino-4-deoxy-L-arabinose transferase-like glycosyltransferase
MLKLIKNNRQILLIVLLAIITRFYSINSMPPALNWDEVSHGYNAYSILKTAKDEWGEFMPVIFRAYGDHKLPGYIYTTALSVLIFGLNTFAVRLPSVLAGVLLVVLTYLLSVRLFNKRVGTISAFLIAVAPWSLFLSRGAFEANLAAALFLAGIYIFLAGLDKPKMLIISAAMFGLSVWTYNSYRVFAPVMLTFLLLLYKRKLIKLFAISRNTTIGSILIILVFFVPMVVQLLNTSGQARYGKVTIIDEGAINQIIQSRENSPFSDTVTRLIYNRPVFFTKQFFSNFIQHYSGNFLYFKGGSHYQFSIPGHGLLYWINIPFMIAGIYFLIKRRTPAAVLLLAWFYLAPIPSSITREAPHVLRSITFLPVPMIITAYGFSKVMEKIRFTKKHFVTAALLYFIVIMGFAAKYLLNYFGEYKNNYSWAWQYGYKQVVDYTKANYDNYDKILVTKKYGEPHEFFLFYWPWEPSGYQTDPNLNRFAKSDWYWVDGFDKIYFLNDWEISEKSIFDIPRSLEEEDKFKLESGEVVNCYSTDAKCLLVTSPGNSPGDWNRLESIDFLDGTPAYEIYEN